MILVDSCIVDEQLSGVFHKWRDFADVQGLFEDDSGSGIGLLGLQGFDCLCGIIDYFYGLHGTAFIDRSECRVFSPVVAAVLAVIFHYFEQELSVVISPKKHHKWRDISDVQGLFAAVMDWGHFDLMRILQGIKLRKFGLVETSCWIFWVAACLLLSFVGLPSRCGLQYGVSNGTRLGVIYLSC